MKYKKKLIYAHMKAHLPLIECKFFYKMIEINYFNAYRDIHATKNKFKCKICFKTFKTSSNFKIHVKTHNKIFKCENCNKMFRSSTILRTHLRDYQENPKIFECEICDRNFNMKFSTPFPKNVIQVPAMWLCDWY